MQKIFLEGFRVSIIAKNDVRPEGATPTDAPCEAWKYPWGDASLRDSRTTHERGEQSRTLN